MKYREIGQQLGISSKSVCTLLARAIRKLQALTQSRSSGDELRGLLEREVRNALQ